MSVPSDRRLRPEGDDPSDLTSPKTSTRPARPRPLDDVDDLPRRPRAVRPDHEQDDTPPRPHPRRSEDEEEPQPRQRKKQPSGPWVVALVGGGGAAGLVLVLVVGAAIWYVARTRANIDAAEWQKVDHPEMGFQALLPGTPRQTQKALDTPAGKIAQTKFMVEPKGKDEFYMIVSTQFPDEAGRRLGGPERLLDLGRKDLLAVQPAQVQSEKPIALNGYSGRELELVPARGVIVKARIYARNNQIFTVMAGVHENRLASKDVEKFFDSFQMSAQPVTMPSTTVGRAGGPPSLPVTLPPGQR